MTNNIIAFDESGNTGENLIDASQPFFSMASINFTNDNIKQFRNYFRVNSDEYHFVKMWKYGKHQKSIINFLNSDLINDSKVKFSVFDKEFAVTCQIVDFLIEPVMFQSGLDLYDNGSVYGYASVLHSILLSEGYGEGGMKNLHNSFIRMMRNKSTADKIMFLKVINDFQKTCKIKSFMDMFIPILSNPFFVFELIDNYEAYQIDLTFTAFFVLNGKWTKSLNPQRYNLLIDNSKQLNYFEEIIKLTRSRSMMSKSNFQGRLSDLEYPVNIASYEFVDSKKYVEVQIADMIASSITFALKNRNTKNKEFASKIIASKLFGLDANVISYNKDFMNDMKGRENHMTYFAKNLGANRKRYNI